ncbi:hypothetical protein EGY25_03285 [Brevundimonas intermedia]|uniref:Uncharacterized protein n=1 Tax=Brevundimonas intermedia TaxID=74315 RepID=A0A4Y9S2T1_9CAUL|nr:hypothetical protein [Brevundimonas intermedia]TFW14235.1 hypothetical protein EGY25_03285 [Brevundimonas intermedia]
MAPKLKVFTWSDGFHAFTVATSSRPKALEAWGSKQDLFATGLASQLSGGPDYEIALASPGEVIERGLAVDIGKIEKAKPKSPRRPSKAKRDKIGKLQATLADLDDAHQSAVVDLDARQKALDVERQRIKIEYEQTRKGLTSELKKARA